MTRVKQKLETVLSLASIEYINKNTSHIEVLHEFDESNPYIAHVEIKGTFKQVRIEIFMDAFNVISTIQINQEGKQPIYYTTSLYIQIPNVGFQVGPNPYFILCNYMGWVKC